MNIYRSTLQEGVFLSVCNTNKFKSALMTVSFALPLEEETASGYSLLTNLLSLSTGDYPTMQSFSLIKDELYALGLDAYVQRKGETLLVTLEISTISDLYAFDGERLLFRATELLGGAIFRPYLVDGIFPSDNLEGEKKCLIEEITSIIESKPAYAMKRSREIMCPGEPFAVDAAGTVEGVSALDGSALMNYYNKLLTDAPVYINYTGDADFQYVEECVKAHLPFAPRKFTLPKMVVHPARNEILRVKETMEMEQSVLILGLLVEMPSSAKKRAVLSVYDEIFGGSPSSKLFMNVREKEGLCYYCSSHPSGRKNIIFVSCGLERGMEQQAIDAIYRQVTAMAEGDFSDSDLENAKNSIIRSLHSMEGSLSSINSYMLGQLILEDAATLDQNIEYVSKVTREEVIAVAKTVLPELEYILCGEGEQ